MAQRSNGREPSVHTITRRMDQRLRTRNLTVTTATGQNPIDHEMPASQRWNPEVCALPAHGMAVVTRLQKHCQPCGATG
jgi:hypothetical protein